jgi:hypothetical protein
MKRILVILGVVFLTTTVHAQMKLGLVAGVNMSDEVVSFAHSPNSKATNMPTLKGLLIGPTIELMVKNIDIGVELGSFYSRKGSNFSYMLDNPLKSYSILLDGYKNVEYLEIPLTLKWKFGPRDFKMYVSAGYYWGYAFSGSVVVEQAQDLLNNNQPMPELVKTSVMKFGDNRTVSYNTLDGGYTIGAGVEIVETIQLSAYYSYGTKSIANEKSILDLLPEATYGYDDGDYKLSSNNSCFSIRLTYLFSR